MMQISGMLSQQSYRWTKVRLVKYSIAQHTGSNTRRQAHYETGRVEPLLDGATPKFLQRLEFSSNAFSYPAQPLREGITSRPHYSREKPDLTIITQNGKTNRINPNRQSCNLF